MHNVTSSLHVKYSTYTIQYTYECLPIDIWDVNERGFWQHHEYLPIHILFQSQLHRICHMPRLQKDDRTSVEAFESRHVVADERRFHVVRTKRIAFDTQQQYIEKISLDYFLGESKANFTMLSNVNSLGTCALVNNQSQITLKWFRSGGASVNDLPYWSLLSLSEINVCQ